MASNKAERFTQRTGKQIEGKHSKNVEQERNTKNDYRDNREHGRIKHKMAGAHTAGKDYSGNKAEQFTKKIKQEPAVQRGKNAPSRGR